MANCRLAVIYTESSAPLLEIYEALKLAAQNDPYAKRLKAGFTSHGDGWGYAAAALGERPSLTVYKTSIPIWRDTEPPIHTPAAALLHARKASRGTPISLPAAHPYLVAANDGTLLAIAQNGGLDRESLAALLDELGAAHPQPDKVSDTHLYAYLIAHLYSENPRPLAEVLGEAYRLIGQYSLKHCCLNTAALALTPGGGVELAVSRHIYTVDKPLLEYCELYLVEDDGFRAIVSSTLAAHLDKYSPVKLGENRVVTIYSQPEARP